MFRRPIFVIVGATNLGKSLLAADVLRKVARVLGLTPNDSQAACSEDATQQPYLEVRVEENTELDLSDYDLTAHVGVLLDGVGNAQFLKKRIERSFRDDRKYVKAESQEQ